MNGKMRSEFDETVEICGDAEKFTGNRQLKLGCLAYFIHGYQAALAQQAEPAQVSQPVAFKIVETSKNNGFSTTHYYETVPETCEVGNKFFTYVITPLYLAPPDYEALKDENEALKLRVAELEEAQLAKVVMLENNSKADDRLISSSDSLIQSMRLEAETLKSRVAELEAESDCDFKEYKRLRDKFQYGFFGGLPEAEIDEGVDVDIQEQAR